MIHEKAAKEAHPGARDFKPVRNLARRVVGWTFEIPRDGEASVDFGWVTAGGEASSDMLERQLDAERGLRAYCSLRGRSVNEWEKRA